VAGVREPAPWLAGQWNSFYKRTCNWVANACACKYALYCTLTSKPCIYQQSRTSMAKGGLAGPLLKRPCRLTSEQGLCHYDSVHLPFCGTSSAAAKQRLYNTFTATQQAERSPADSPNPSSLNPVR
jgi:hypothetical protein